MVVLIDFGSQTAHLIARRVREFGITVEIVEPEHALSAVKKFKSSGIILSGGPSSVYEKGAPTIDRKIFSLGIPILAICYGFQLTSHLLGGKVVSGKKEYGPALLRRMSNTTNFKFPISNKIPKEFTVWMSHGDEITKLPAGFENLGSTEHVPHAFVINKKKKILGLLFHPEIEHTEYGTDILEQFISMTGIKKSKHKIDIDKIIQKIKAQVGDAYVIGAVSGGVDSTVASALVARAIGKNFTGFYVDNGLMRIGTTEHVRSIYSHLDVDFDIINGEKEMLKRLKGITDSEQKRKIIGNYYIEVFEAEMRRLRKEGKKVKFLMQGTIYSDVIESKGSKHADKIKSHHNVGGLPEKMKLELLEPLRDFYKDEVREIGTSLGLPKEFVWKQVFPGPGYGVRIRGEVTAKRLAQAKQADQIILEELEKADWLPKVYMSFPVMTGAYSTAVKGDGRSFSEVVALRIIESKDIMSTVWARIPYDLLQKISSRIVNEVPEVSRVVYDITTKPPATMEWE